jgi:GH24 family phage-related lysozyme (muramidase)
MKRHEGFREFAYPDPLSPLARRYPINKYWGHRLAQEVLNELGQTEALGRPWTYGYGFTEGVTPSHSIQRIVADRKLEQKVMEYSVMLDPLVPDWKKYPMVVQTVLVNLMYNMGPSRLSKFVTTLELIKAGKYQDAGRNLRKTLWFKQVGTRAVELTDRLINMRIEPNHVYKEI